MGKGCAGCACTRRMRTLWVWSGAWGCPHLCTSLTLFLFSFTSPHHARPSLVMLPLPQSVSSVGQGLCWLCGTDRMRMLWVWSDAWECPPCSLPRLYFCSRLCLPTMRFPPLPCFLWSCRPPPAPPSRASLPLAQPLSGLEGSPPLVNFSSASGATRAQCFAREPEYKSCFLRRSW